MSYYLKVMKDNPIGLWKLDEESGTTALDSSGCGNNGLYFGQIYYGYAPMIPGGKNSSKITDSSYINFSVTKDYYGSNAKGGLANKYSSDNDFSLEIWTYLNLYNETNIDIFDGGNVDNNSSSFFDGGLYSTEEYNDSLDAGSIINREILIFGDEENNIGIFFNNKKIIFKLGQETLNYSVEEISRSMHIVCIYAKTSMSIYVNGKIVSSKSLENFTFTNELFNIKSGPIKNDQDFILIDAPAIYRYALTSEQILSHFNSSNAISPIQIVDPDNGQLFLTTDNNIKKSFTYSYPFNKPWSDFYDLNLYHDRLENYISIIPTNTTTSKTIILNDQFPIPSNSDLISSKVEWYGTEGIKIETSSDGYNYVECQNGQTVPQYKIGWDRFSLNKYIFVRITISTEDASSFIPKLYNLNFYFYNTKRIYSINGGDYIEPIEPTNGDIDLSIWDYDIASIAENILSRKTNNGIRPHEPGFSIDTMDDIFSIEMFFTPISNDANYLIFSEPDTYFSWDDLGEISKNNIFAIYVNGINISTETNISSFLTVGEAHHIVLVFNSTVTSKIWFNVKVLNNIWTNAGPRNLYSYISIYKDQISQSITENHYNLYTSKSSVVAEIPSFTVTESSINVYNNDWLVIKSI